MKVNELKQEIRVAFANAEIGRIYFAEQNLKLEKEYGFTPENTRFAEGGCCDEINEAEYRALENFWGERFKFGGLAGYCHGGRTGLSAVSHHIPESDGKTNLLLVAGTHIGYYQGEWGKVPRPGQPYPTASCGSLQTVLSADYQTLEEKAEDPLDKQQYAVERLMLPFFERCVSEGSSPDILGATKFLMKRVDDDLNEMVNNLKSVFQGAIALITGVTINTEIGNYFSEHRMQMFM